MLVCVLNFCKKKLKFAENKEVSKRNGCLALISRLHVDLFCQKKYLHFFDNKIKEVEQRNHCLALISSLHVDFLCCHQFGCQWFSVNQLPVKKCEPGIKLWFEKASAISSP